MVKDKAKTLVEAVFITLLALMAAGLGIVLFATDKPDGSSEIAGDIETSPVVQAEYIYVRTDAGLSRVVKFTDGDVTCYYYDGLSCLTIRE